MAREYIICVDDDRTILMSLRAQLKRQLGDEYRYEVAESAEEAWELLEDIHAEGNRVSVIITDWLMPDVKGDEFLIDVHAKFPNIIKIMLTGQAEPEAVLRSEQQANLAACFSKPWSVTEITEVIQQQRVMQAS